MNTRQTRSAESLGFTPEDIERLSSGAQEDQSPFDAEVHQHLQALGATPQDDQSAQQMHQSQTLDRYLASGDGPNTTPPKAKPSDPINFSSLG